MSFRGTYRLQQEEDLVSRAQQLVDYIGNLTWLGCFQKLVGKLEDYCRLH